MSALRPDSNKGHDLGSSSVKWGTLHVGDVSAETVTTSGNVEIGGNLTVTGTQTSLQVQTVEAQDPLIKLARGNSSDAIDIGFYGQSTDGTAEFHGLARDADDGKFYLFKDLGTEPTTVIPTLSAGNKAVLVADLEGNMTGSLTGNADTATTLETARTLSISGDASGSVSFNGSANADIALTIASNAVENSMILNSTITVAGDTGSNAIDLGDTLTIQGTTNEIVTSQVGDTLTIALPDSVSGLTAVSATTFTGALSGNASTASALQTARTLSISGDASGSVSFDGSADGDIAITIGSGAVENSMLANSTIGLTVDGIGGESIPLGQTIDFNGTASQVNIAYSAAGNDLTFSLPSTINVDTSGNAATATALATGRNFSIGSGPVTASAVSFDGTGNVSLTSSIANGALGNALLANSSTSFTDGTTSSAISLGGSLTIQGTANEVEVSNTAGVFSIGLPSTITAAVNGNASTATALETGRTIAIGSGPVTATGVSFDGSQNISLTSAIANGAISNAMLANNSITLTVDGTGGEAIALGDSLDFNGTSNQIDIAYSAAGNDLTFSLPSTINVDTSGNAGTATALASSRNIGITSGPVTAANISFDGSGNVALTSAIANGAISNAMLANDGINLKLNGTSQEDINLGDSLDFSGTASQIDIAYNTASNDLTFSLPSTINVDTSGNAATATALATSRSIALTGDVSGSASFDGSANASITTTIGTGAVDNAMLANSSFTVSDTSNSEAISLGDTLYFGGTSSEIDVAYNASLNKFTFSLPSSVNVTTNLDVGSGLTVGGNATITGNISAAGLTATGANVTFSDNLLELGVNNTDLEDIGFYGQRGDGIGGSNGFAGVAWDESASKFIAFTSSGEPTTTVGSHTPADMKVGDIEATDVVASGVSSGQLRSLGAAPSTASDTGTAGDIRYDSGYLYVCTATNTWKRVGISTF